MSLTLEAFIEEVNFDWQENKESVKYLFFLGAGCSKSSGIDLASELANKWYEKLESNKPSAFKNFKKSNVKCNNENKSEYYFEIFTALFPDALAQQKEIQRLVKGKLPAVGYYILAELMQIRAFNTVITTNFDDLIQDALIYSNKERALVVTHEDLAEFIDRGDTPLVCKIHGDAHLSPFNSKEKTKQLPKKLQDKLEGLLHNTKVIFIGYSGQDESVEGLFKACTTLPQVYWINKNEPQGEKFKQWWDELETKVWVEEYDFDKVMGALKSKFSLPSPSFYDLVNKLEDAYKEDLQEEVSQVPSDDKDVLTLLLLGNNYFELKEYSKAIEAYQKAIEINPKQDAAYYNMGLAYNELKEYAKAIEAYQKAIEINPKQDEAYNNMGVAYDELKEYSKAIEAYQKAIEINPKKDEAYNNMGVAYRKLKEYAKAIEAYQKAIEINPKQDEAYYNMGVAYDELKEYSKAIETYQKAIEINPKQDAAYLNYLELQLIHQNKLDEGILKTFYTHVSDKEKHMAAEMLEGLEQIVSRKSYDISTWKEKYSGTTHKGWSFKELESWIATKDNTMQQKLKKALNVYKTKFK